MTLPSWGDAWLAVRHSSDPAILLLTITHPNMETVRLAKNSEDIVSRGDTFHAAWFEVDWVNNDGELPRCSLSVPNVDNKKIGMKYFYDPIPPRVILEVIAASLPDEPLARVANLEVRAKTLTPIAIQGQLTGIDHSSEPLGLIVVTPEKFPALFRRQRKV